MIIIAPAGTGNHGDDHLLCTPSRWNDIFVFFFANYVAHAATVKSIPGEPALLAIWALLCALLFPVSGVMRGVDAILQHAVTARTPLEAASKAGALCMVVRTKEWKPQRGDRTKGVKTGVPDSRQGDAGAGGAGQRDISIGGDLELEKISENLTRRGLRADDEEITDNAEGAPSRPPLDHESRDLDAIDGPAPSAEEVAILPTCRVRVDFRQIVYGPEFIPAVGKTSIEGRKVHGAIVLPQGYKLSMLPSGTQVRELGGDEVSKASSDSMFGRWKKAMKRSRTATVQGQNSRDIEPEPHASHDIASSYGFAKGVVAISQTIYATVTLYRTQGDQLKQYGYASFGLTVAPYLIMSLINLLGTILTPDYPAVYLIHSEIMDEALRREASRFEGVVGRLVADEPSSDGAFDISFSANDADELIAHKHRPPSNVGSKTESSNNKEQIASTSLLDADNLVEASHRTEYLIPRAPSFPGGSKLPLSRRADIIYASILISCIALAVVGGLSRFRAGNSTIWQRFFTMAWLVCGIVVGPSAQFSDMESPIGSNSASRIQLKDILILIAGGPSAMSGFVVVGMMLAEYGRCLRMY
jgi:hypothetical protein